MNCNLYSVKKDLLLVVQCNSFHRSVGFLKSGPTRGIFTILYKSFPFLSQIKAEGFHMNTLYRLHNPVCAGGVWQNRDSVSEFQLRKYFRSQSLVNLWRAFRNSELNHGSCQNSEDVRVGEYVCVWECFRRKNLLHGDIFHVLPAFQIRLAVGSWASQVCIPCCSDMLLTSRGFTKLAQAWCEIKYEANETYNTSFFLVKLSIFRSPQAVE